MMGRTTRMICIVPALGSLLLAGCTRGTGTVVPAELGREAPPPSVTVASTPTTTNQPTAETPLETAGSPDAGGSAGAAPPNSNPSTTIAEPTGDTDRAGPRLSDGLGTPVTDAPSVRTRGDTRRLLDEGLYVHLAWEPDPADASVFTPLPDDVPILEAYTNAQIAYYRAALGLAPPDDTMLDRFLVDGSTRFAAAFAARAAAGLTLQLGSGVVLRPYVLGDQRTATSAVVLDCYLHDEQEVPVGAQALPGPMRTYGLVATMVLVDGRWKIDRTGTEPGVCL
jgi:hypothetical protein